MNQILFPFKIKRHGLGPTRDVIYVSTLKSRTQFVNFQFFFIHRICFFCWDCLACFTPPQVMKVSSHHQPYSLPQVLVVFVCRAHLLGRRCFFLVFYSHSHASLPRVLFCLWLTNPTSSRPHVWGWPQHITTS